MPSTDIPITIRLADWPEVKELIAAADALDDGAEPCPYDHMAVDSVLLMRLQNAVGKFLDR